MKRLPSFLLGCGLLAASIAITSTLAAEPEAEKPARLILAPQHSHEVSPLLFGQFLERFGAKASGTGELGPQAALQPGVREKASDTPAGQIPENSSLERLDRLQPGVVEALSELNATIIRFPGGGAVASLYDWTQLIDDSPLREDPARPEGFEFGLPEFFALCEALGAAPLPVVNFRSSVWGTLPGQTALSPEEFAAGLVAYCNLPVGADLPAGMLDWPAIRAANGHPEPHNVRYFQIGNEWVAWLHATSNVREKIGLEAFADDEAFVAHVSENLLSMIEAMRAVDPQIEIIIDAVMWEDSHEPWFRAILGDERIQTAADFATVHLYRPWGVNKFEKDGDPVEGDQLSPEEIWYSAVAAPNIDQDGQSVLRSNSWSLAREMGWRVTLTEWNWNGWGVERRGATLWPRALGVAGFLHALLREAEHIELATQSMMIGNHWMINGVRVDPTGEDAPFVLPSGRLTGFYTEHSGDRFVPVSLEDVPVRPQPVSMGSLQATPSLALIDAVATESDEAVFLHLINRDKDLPHPILLEPTDRQFAPEGLVHRIVGGSWNPVRSLFVSPGQFEESTGTISLSDLSQPIELPPASVTIIELRKEQP